MSDVYYSNYIYLILNVASVFFPFLLSFDKKVAFYKHFPKVFAAIGLSGLIFIIWDLIFAHYKVWSFNPDYIIADLPGLPIEEYLFFITVPFSCIFIYYCLRAYIINLKSFTKVSGGVLVMILIVCINIAVMNYFRLYSFLNAILAVAISILWLWKVIDTRYGTFKYSLPYMVLCYMITLIPFALVNGILTSHPVVMYNSDHIMGIRAGTIPIEDFIYNYNLLALPIWILSYWEELATNRARSSAGGTNSGLMTKSAL